jgi:nucleoid-associated protein EbfC
MSGQGFGFGLGKLKEIQQAVQKAKEIEQGAKALQEELEEMRIVGQSSNGLVKVTISGNQEPQDVEINPAALEVGAEILSDLVLAALQEAYSLSTATMKERMEKLTGGLGLPGGLGGF